MPFLNENNRLSSNPVEPRPLSDNHSGHVENGGHSTSGDSKNSSNPNARNLGSGSHKSFITTYDVHHAFSDRLHPELRGQVANDLGLGAHKYDKRVTDAMKQIEEIILSKDTNHNGRITAAEKNPQGHVWQPGMAELLRKKKERREVLEGDGVVTKREGWEMKRQGIIRNFVNKLLNKWF